MSLCRTGCFARLPPIAEQLQQVDEEIQEIQIQVPRGKCIHVLSLCCNYIQTNLENKIAVECGIKLNICDTLRSSFTNAGAPVEGFPVALHMQVRTFLQIAKIQGGKCLRP